MTRHLTRHLNRVKRPAGRICPAAAPLAMLLVAGCSLPSIHLIEQSPPPFVQTDNVDAPPPRSDDKERTRRLFLGVVSGLRQQGRAAAALAFLDDYDRTYPRDQQAALLRADCLVDLDQQAAAEPIYRRLLDAPEQAAAARAGLGQVAALAGRWSEAAHAFGQAAAMGPSNVRYLNNQGYALLRAGDAAQAEFVLRKAAQLDPGNQQTRNNLILCLQRQGKPVPGLQQVAAADLPFTTATLAGAGPAVGAGPAQTPGQAIPGRALHASVLAAPGGGE